MKRRHVLALVASAALVLPAGGLWLWARHAENVLAAAQQRCRDAGLPMTIDDIRPPPVPDEDNASLVLAKLEPMLKALKADDDEKSLFRVIDRLEETKTTQFLTEDELTELESAFAAQPVKDVLALIEEMTARRAFDAELRYEEGIDLLMPHIGPMIGSIRILGWHARFTAARQQPEIALRRIDQVLKCAYLVSSEPALISQFTRMAGIRIAITEMEMLASDGAHASRVASEFFEQLSSISLRDAAARSLDVERICHGSDVFMKLEKRGSKIVEKLAGKSAAAETLYSIYRFPGVLYFEHATYKNRLAEGSLLLRDRAPYDEIARQLSHANDVPKRMLVIRAILPALAAVAKRTFQNEARLSAARIGLALDRYRAAHGVYPAALAELAPAFLPEVPQDFFSGKAFVYVRDADGLGALVYSVGPNMRDEGGVKDDPSAAGGATGTGDRDDESWACGAAAKRKFAPRTPAASASAPAP